MLTPNSADLADLRTYLRTTPRQGRCIPVAKVDTYLIGRLLSCPAVRDLLRKIIQLGYTPYIQDSSVPHGTIRGYRIWAINGKTGRSNLIDVRSRYNGLLGYIQLESKDTSADKYLPLNKVNS